MKQLKKSAIVISLAFKFKINIFFLVLNIFFFGIMFFAIPVKAVVLTETSSITMSAIVTSTSPAVIVINSGSGSLIPKSGVLIFRGYAYPEAFLTLRKNGEIISVFNANLNGFFELALSRMDLGVFDFNLGAKEILSGELSPIFKFNINLEKDSNTVIDGIFFPPTIHANKSEVISGDVIKFFGRTVPNAKVVLEVGPHSEILNLTSDDLGNWVFNYNTSGIEKGNYYIKSKAILNNLFSIYSQTINFKVGDKTIEIKPEVKTEQEQKPPVEIEIPLFPTTTISKEEPIISEKNKIQDLNSYLYLLLLLLPLLLLLEKKKICSYGIIPTTIKDGQVMFLLIKSHLGFWTFPRGHQEENENEVDTAFRELIEETGISQCAIEKNISFSESYKIKIGKKRFIKVNKYFLGFVRDTKVVIDNKEVIDYRWATFEEALDLFSYENSKVILYKANQALMVKK